MSVESIEDISILMVVPSRVLGAVIRKELGDMGVVQMAACKNIEQALDQLREVKPDLVVSSMYFEDGDGIDLIMRMREEEAFKDTLFMLISGEERFEMLDPIRQAGVVAMLPRPFTHDALLHAVNSSLGLLSENGFVEESENINLSDIRVLLVDDSKLARRHMLNVLRKVGVSEELVFQAEDGQEAVDKLGKAEFDLIVTDYNMPKMDGEELLKFIRQDDEINKIPVIMVTSEQDETKLGSIKSHGVTAMMDKPFDAPHLISLLEMHL
jgi:two-component system chemotaxis response regulator CheY